MDLIVCGTCGRPIAKALEPGVKLKGVCSACQPDPAAMLRFAMAVREARKLSGHKQAYCAARVGVSDRQWRRWETCYGLEPPVELRDRLLSLFADTRGAQVMLKEVQSWPA